jgi:STE24 endopeptidase
LNRANLKKLKLFLVCVLANPFLTSPQPSIDWSQTAHELGHWYYLHPTKLMAVSQFHIFAILALFPAFLHSPPLLRSFDFPKAVAARPPTIVSFLLFQVRSMSSFVGKLI